MNYIYIILSILLTFVAGVIFAPLVLKLSKRFHASQTILHYVEAHKQKEGTPTMGGFIFIFPIAIMSLLFAGKDSSLLILSIAVMFAFMILGFLDDYIKVKYKQNEGLKPYQKIIGQFGIALLLGVFCYVSSLGLTHVNIPFTNSSIDFDVWIIPFVMLVFLATTNSVNLTDGLDGLAGGVSLAFFAGLALIVGLEISSFGYGQVAIRELSNLLICICCSIGGLLAFLCFNAFPAKIFMGDTGSLGLGGLIGALCVFSHNSLYIPILGLMFVLSAISDIIQVLHYKRTKKRIFLMAPLHHHFEKKGVHENRIVLIYIVITALISAISVLLYIVIGR